MPQPHPCRTHTGSGPLPARTTGFRRLRAALVAGGMVALSGCNHQDAVDSTFDWVDKIRGGVIATQRPPAPGLYDPYPHVGLTRTDPPDVTSPQARALLTQRLLRDRNLTYRTVAANGSLIPDIPPPPGGTAPKAELPAGASGAVLDAAEAPPRPQQTQSSRPQPDTPSTAASPDGEIALPTVRDDKGATDPQVLPAIPAAPPPPPQIAGVATPADTPTASTRTPNYDLSDVKGTAFHFLPDSDQLSSGQNTVLAQLVDKTPKGPFYIRGFGNATALDAITQTDAVRLGLLRASRLAQLLIARGVPATALHVRGDAFGTGARVSTTP